MGRVEDHKLKVCGTKSLLADFDDFGGVSCRFIAEFGEVVSAACEFEEEGFVCFFFERTASSWWRRRWIGSAADPNVT